jgi:uncharacterized protein (TIGR02284 family)
MMTTAVPEPAVKTLNQLIEVCRDGQKGFETAAAAVKTLDVKQLLKSYATQRACFATELQSEVTRLGGQPQEAGSIEATLHRGWINIKSLLTGASDTAIVAECERGETAALDAYHAALKADLPEEARTVVARQLEHVQEARDRVHVLGEVRAKV